MKDKVVEQVKREYDVRSCVGIKKYGTTLEQNNTDNFLQHLKEELMDAVLYLQKLQNQEGSEPYYLDFVLNHAFNQALVNKSKLRNSNEISEFVSDFINKNYPNE